MKNLLVITLLFSSFGFGSVFDQTVDITSLECMPEKSNSLGNKPKVIIRINNFTKELRYQMLKKVKFEVKTYWGQEMIYADYGRFNFYVGINPFNMVLWDIFKDKEGNPDAKDSYYQCKAIL